MNLSKLFFILVLILPTFILGQEEDFTRPLPGKDLTDQITAKKFPNSDAVIILKEQSFQETADKYYYYGFDIPTKHTVVTKVLIVKLLNESAVKRYGSFEYEYLEPFGNEIKNGFTAKARVLKPDGQVYVMPEDEVKILVTSEDKNGDPLTRKALFSVPNLAAGDILQIEYQTLSMFSASSSGVFYYDDEDITLFSNLYLTLPANEDVIFEHYPPDLVGKPKVVQISQRLGDGETYFWSLRNLKAAPSEPFSLPFSERAIRTRFYMEYKSLFSENSWSSLLQWYYDKVLDKGSVDSDDLKLLGIKKNENNITLGKIDSLYTALRKYFALEAFSYPYPNIDDIDEVFEAKKGNASDLAYIMYKVLEQWKFKAKGVLIRDRRTGKYDITNPSLAWFNRLGILVNIDGKERLYDFDRSLPSTPENPWYLNKIIMPVVEDKPMLQKEYSFDDKPENNTASEIHKLSFINNSELKESLELSWCGSLAQRLRNNLYAMEKNKTEEFFRTMITSGSIPKPEQIQLNNYFDESRITANTSGISRFKCEVIDSFLTVNIGSTMLSEFRDRLYTAKRYNDIYFDSPFSFAAQYEIPVPEGYRLYKLPPGHYRNFESNMRFSISYSVNGGRVIITAKENIGQTFYPVKSYKDIMEHLDNSIKEIGTDLIFVKERIKISSGKLN